MKTEMRDRFGELPRAAKNVFLYYKNSFLADKNQLNSLNIGKNKIEFNFSNPLTKNAIEQIVKNVEYEISFKQTKNFRILVHVPTNKVKDFSQNYYTSLKILKAITHTSKNN